MSTTSQQRQTKHTINDGMFAQPRIIPQGASLVTAITGWRGALKTLIMTYLCVMDMKQGRKVKSTEFIKGPVKRNGKLVVVQSEPLTFDSILAMDENLRGCVIAIDEINLWFGAMRAMTNQNQIMSKFTQMIRHRQVSLYYTGQRFQSIDFSIRWQTDLHVACRDMFHSPAGKELGLGRGEWLQYVAIDKSGYLTGIPYEISGEFSSGILEARPMWHYYNTEGSVDVWEAMAKVEFKRPTKVIDLTGGGQGEEGEEGEDGVPPMPSPDEADIQRMLRAQERLAKGEAG